MQFISLSDAEIEAVAAYLKALKRERGYVAGTPENVQAVRDLQVVGLPSTVFITPNGKVHKKRVGSLNERKLTELVEDLVKAS